MKRVFLIMSVLLVNVSLFANASFDKTINYQFNNAKAYEGEELYLLPLTHSSYEKRVDKYNWFKSMDFDDDTETYHSVRTQYKLGFDDYRDYNLAGTDKRHIEGHHFYVYKVVPYQDSKTIWIFYLTDLKTNDKLKFIYHGTTLRFEDSFSEFPFIVMKHFNYCKSLIGTNLVFATNRCNILIAEKTGYYYYTFENDIETGEKINYSGTYAKWTIKNVVVDIYNSCISFIVTNGKQTTKVPYNFQYSENNPGYNIGNRVFPEKQWNYLVNKYGEAHMSMIMNSEVSDDMTMEEKYMVGGRKAANDYSNNKIKKFLGDTDEKDAIEVLKEGIKSSTKEIISDTKELINRFMK